MCDRAANADIEAASRHGYEPLQWLRWIFATALRHNLDTDAIYARLCEWMPVQYVRRVFNKSVHFLFNITLKESASKLIFAPPAAPTSNWTCAA